MFEFYSKVDCPPCVYYKEMLRTKFDEGTYVIHEFATDEAVLDNILKYGVKTVPFVVYKDKVLKGVDLFKFLARGKISLETFEPIEIITDKLDSL